MYCCAFGELSTVKHNTFPEKIKRATVCFYFYYFHSYMHIYYKYFQSFQTSRFPIFHHSATNTNVKITKVIRILTKITQFLFPNYQTDMPLLTSNHFPIHFFTLQWTLYFYINEKWYVFDCELVVFQDNRPIKC